MPGDATGGGAANAALGPELARGAAESANVTGPEPISDAAFSLAAAITGASTVARPPLGMGNTPLEGTAGSGTGIGPSSTGAAGAPGGAAAATCAAGATGAAGTGNGGGTKGAEGAAGAAGALAATGDAGGGWSTWPTGAKTVSSSGG